MFKHLEDEGDFSMLVNDAGQVLIVCSKCKKQWAWELTAVVPSDAEAFAPDILATFRTASPEILMEMGLTADVTPD